MNNRRGSGRDGFVLDIWSFVHYLSHLGNHILFRRKRLVDDFTSTRTTCHLGTTRKRYNSSRVFDECCFRKVKVELKGHFPQPPSSSNPCPARFFLKTYTPCFSSSSTALLSPTISPDSLRLDCIALFFPTFQAEAFEAFHSFTAFLHASIFSSRPSS